ncbi:hypothetical protein PAMA_018265 [Pampus argenteus]
MLRRAVAGLGPDPGARPRPCKGENIHPQDCSFSTSKLHIRGVFEHGCSDQPGVVKITISWVLKAPDNLLDLTNLTTEDMAYDPDTHLRTNTLLA